MVPSPPSADTAFVTFTCRHDVHYAKALLGSVAFFYPCHPIHVVCERDVPEADFRQMQRFPNVVAHRVPDLIARHKLHLTRLLAKFNVFFLPGVERALVADADSVLVDLVLSRISNESVFTALAARPIDLEMKDDRQTFSSWCIDLAAMDKLGWSFRGASRYYVGGSHFYIDISRFPRQLLYDMLPHMGFDHDTHTALRAGDQGFWSFVVNCWQHPLAQSVSVMDVAPGAVAAAATSLPRAGDIEWIEDRSVKQSSFIHYIGFSRRVLRRSHVFSEVLCWATRQYYLRLPAADRFVGDEVRRLARTYSTIVRNRVGLAPTRR